LKRYINSVLSVCTVGLNEITLATVPAVAILLLSKYA
jgi:hypothetical protein